MTSDRFPGTLKTSELLAKIETDLGLYVEQVTIRAWIARAENPLVPVYKGKNGQSHRFDWLEFLAWYDLYGDVENTHGNASATDPDALDWHGARTVSARAQAKRDLILTANLEGKYGEVASFEATAENASREATIALLAIPSRLAPALVGKDEMEINRLLDTELRRVCQELQAAADRALSDEDLPEIAA